MKTICSPATQIDADPDPQRGPDALDQMRADVGRRNDIGRYTRTGVTAAQLAGAAVCVATPPSAAC